MSVAKRIGILVIILSFVISSCAVNPVTEKREIMLFSDQDEIALEKQGNEAVLLQFGTYDDPSLQKYIDQVGQKIAQVCHRKDLPHHYTVVDSAQDKTPPAGSLIGKREVEGKTLRGEGDLL